MKTLNTTTNIDNSLLGEIYQAHELLGAATSPVKRTVLLHDQQLSHKYNADVWLASEIHQAIGAYKIRGAYNFISQISAQCPGQIVVSASAGNHAQGIALSSNILGVDCHIFMPECTPQNKVDAVARLGGLCTKITLTGSNYDQAQAAAQQHCQQRQGVYASAFNDRRVIAGQGTWGIEITQQLDDIDAVFCPVGGMGLLAGVGTVIKNLRSSTALIGVEPSGAASLTQAMNGGGTLSSIDTFVDGAAVCRVGDVPFALASKLVDDVVAVSNQQVRRVVTDFWEGQTPLRPELAGALSVAGLAKHTKQIRGKRVVCLITGGNLSPERYQKEVKIS